MKFLKNIFKTYNGKITANNLLCGMGDSEIGKDTILIKEYPFEPSIAYPEKLIKASEINSICVDFGVLKIKIKDDIVFMSAEKKEQLKIFAEKNKIPLFAYSWNWDWILEPYLDTEYTTENDQLVTDRLLENGFDKIEINEIRKEVGKQMYSYNFDTMLWDWCSLSLIDVLSAMRAKYNKEDFRDFYTRAMKIEKREKQN
ncbi:hypothetical protein [uncultured Aquimarina sp.]|uniref:hypothetical protein n=1 Tax=uncultured Aquimarina sp. TaxID=575652 RepID=UPI0026338311|nr:hypothetical protein [uncultured Aquimarina sp.]